RIQHRGGERKNRHKARMKFLVKKLGAANFASAVKAEMEKVVRERGPELRADVREAVAGWRTRPAGPGLPAVAPLAGFDGWQATNAAPHKAPQLASATIVLPLGDITSDQLRAVARLARELGNGTVRATNEQNLVLQSVRRSMLPRLHRALGELGLAESGASLVTDVVSCPGLDYCSLAVTRSMGVEIGRAHV